MNADAMRIVVNMKRAPEGPESFEERQRLDRAETLWRESRVPARHAAIKFGLIRGVEWAQAFGKATDSLGCGMLIALCGPRGTGKTQMAVEAIRACCGRGKVARYTTAMDFFMAVKETYDDNARRSESLAIAAFVKPALLVIDEVQDRGETDWENRLLAHMINKRYAALRDTLLITNLTPDSLVASVGDSIRSRMDETGGIIRCEWSSFR